MFAPKGLQRIGDVWDQADTICFNRTGSAVQKGDLVMLDFAASATETTTFERGEETNVDANVVTVTQAGVDLGYPILVAMEEIADNDRGRFLQSGVFEVSCLDDDAATTDADIGDGIGILVSESALAAQGLATTDHRNLGYWRANAEASGSSGDRTPKLALWLGGYPLIGYSRDA